jgi:hypothetical protein
MASLLISFWTSSLIAKFAWLRIYFFAIVIELSLRSFYLSFSINSFCSLESTGLESTYIVALEI